MQIKRLDSAALDLALPVLQSVSAQLMPGFPAPEATRLRFWCSDGYQHSSLVLGAFDDPAVPQPCGLAIYEVETHSNLDLALLSIWVAAGSRRRGAGSALFNECRVIAASQGRTRLSVNGSSADDSTAAVTRFGGRLVETTTRSILDLTAVDRATLVEWASPTPDNETYTLVQWVDHTPAELADSFCAAMSAMDDAPREEFAYKPPQHDLKMLRAKEEHAVGYGVRRHTHAALDSAGRVVGFCTFTSMPDEPEVIDIWDTGVVRAHRGHGLGLRIKSAASLQMIDDYPKVRWVQTFNNVDNEPMLRVNRAMGYQTAESWFNFEFTI